MASPYHRSENDGSQHDNLSGASSSSATPLSHPTRLQAQRIPGPLSLHPHSADLGRSPVASGSSSPAAPTPSLAYPSPLQRQHEYINSYYYGNYDHEISDSDSHDPASPAQPLSAPQSLSTSLSLPSLYPSPSRVNNPVPRRDISQDVTMQTNLDQLQRISDSPEPYHPPLASSSRPSPAPSANGNDRDEIIRYAQPERSAVPSASTTRQASVVGDVSSWPPTTEDPFRYDLDDDRGEWGLQSRQNGPFRGLTASSGMSGGGSDEVAPPLRDGPWLASDMSLPLNSAPDSLYDHESAALKSNAAAPARRQNPLGTQPQSSSSNTAVSRSSETPEKGRALGFAPPQLVSSPDGMPSSTDLPDIEGSPRLRFDMSTKPEGYSNARNSQDQPFYAGGRVNVNRLHKSFKRMSRRVVDLANAPQPGPQMGHVPLIDEGESDSEGEAETRHQRAQAEMGREALLPEEDASPIDPYALRGKSLGLMGPDNRFRRAMAHLLKIWWVEPTILILIIANAVILVIQSARDVAGDPREQSFFRSWEDVALLAIFSAYTLEIIGRIIVSGLVINPPPLYVAETSETFDGSGAATRLASDPKSIQSGQLVSSPQVLTSPSRTKEYPFRAESEPFVPSPSGLKRKQLSKSNTLDTFAEMGDMLKNRASTVFKQPEGSDEVPYKTMNSRQSTMLRTAYPPGKDARGHYRTNTTATMASGKVSIAPNMGTDAGAYEFRGMTSSGSPPSEKSRILRGLQHKAIPFSKMIIRQRYQAPHYAFLRHSWNRVDLVAVVCFWIEFFASATGTEEGPGRHIYIFRALSVLRTARLLTLTPGTSTILHSLKLAAPLLANALFFVVFMMVLFAIIGIQSFKGSYRRECIWLGDLQTGINIESGSTYSLGQLCGSWYDSNGTRQSYIQTNGAQSESAAKGFACPVGQQCVQQQFNPYAGTESFDDIFHSLMEVAILISVNGWSGIMYNMIDSDYFAAVLYFVVGIICLNFWLANLFVAVITNSFATISAQTQQSAFAAKTIDDIGSVKDVPVTRYREARKKVANMYKRIWGYTKYLWVAAIIADLGLQATRASYDYANDYRFTSDAELYFTIAFDAEIVMRFISYLLDADWRSFFARDQQGMRNKVDLGLCVITSIIQIPVIRQSGVYPWMTIFQLQRFYRVILVIPRIENLLVRVFGSLSGLLNMIIFLLMMVSLSALMAVQMFRGDILDEVGGESNEFTYKHIFNSFLAQYQIFSSENWNNTLFAVVDSETFYKQSVLAGIFICGWFIFANFIVLQMFIAVINEGFNISDADKKKRQLNRYVRGLELAPMSTTGRVLQKLSPYRWLKDHNAQKLGQKTTADNVHSIAHEAADGVRRAVNDFDGPGTRKSLVRFLNPSRAHQVASVVRKILHVETPQDVSVQLDTVRQREIRQSIGGPDVLGSRMSTRKSTMLPDGVSDDAAAKLFARERQLHRMRSDLGLMHEKPSQKEIDDAHIANAEENPKIAMARAINAHPSFDMTLWVFSNHNKFRRFCQSLVPSSSGERIFGRQHDSRRYLVLQTVVFLNIVASVVIAGVASPTYRRDWYTAHGVRRASWFSLSEVFLSLIFFLEFFIKVVADGFAFAPNAYLLNPWNLLDLAVMGSLIVNMTSELVVIGGVSRFTRALKATRALRLINLSRFTRDTFANLIAGGSRFLDAAVLAILYIIPFAVWGQNMFAGLFYGCNDTSSDVNYKFDCTGVYAASPSEWTFMAPRVWANPTQGSAYSFDNFRSALLILFEIVSLEGWINVMTQAMAIAGLSQQPTTDANQVYALFFVIYNLVGAIFVLTLFVSVIVEGFQSAAGIGLYSVEQKQWVDLKRLIARQRPSKRPVERPLSYWRAFCYDRVRKRDWWPRFMTVLYLVNLATLCTQSFEQGPTAEYVRDIIYLILATIWGVDVLIRLFGLGWTAFRTSWWCLWDSVVVVGIIATTLPLLGGTVTQANVQIQKVCLTAATLKIVARHNGLNQLFRTAVSGLPAIASLLALWFSLFLFFAIMFVEVFGLTKWGFIGPETYSKNFSSLGLALIFLSMTSTGEGWNSYMHDYTVSDPMCTPDSNYLLTDCGSVSWSYALFIGWNVISMYIFLNMFTGTVIENFSFIFRIGGKPILGRDDLRDFRRTWLSYAGPGAYLPCEQLVPFLRALPGKFDVKIYPEELSVENLRQAALSDETASIVSSSSPVKRNRVAEAVSRLRPTASPMPSSKPSSTAGSTYRSRGYPQDLPGRSGRYHRAEGINVKRLRSVLNRFDPSELDARRERFNRIYHEACIISEEDKGISFTNMLTLISQYKLVTDEEALSLEELVERRRLNLKIDDRINLERVRGVMRMTYLRYRYRLIQMERASSRGYGASSVGHGPSTRGYATSSLAHAPSTPGYDPSTDGHGPFSSVGHQFTGEDVPVITVDRSLSPGAGRQPLQIYTHDLGSRQTLDSAPISGRLSPRFAPSGDDHDALLRGQSPTSTSAGAGLAEPTVAELERRVSPLLESFDDSVWGRMMRRMSVDTNTSTNASHPLQTGSPSLLSQLPRARGGSHSGQSEGHASIRSRLSQSKLSWTMPWQHPRQTSSRGSEAGSLRTSAISHAPSEMVQHPSRSSEGIDRLPTVPATAASYYTHDVAGQERWREDVYNDGDADTVADKTMLMSKRSSEEQEEDRAEIESEAQGQVQAQSQVRRRSRSRTREEQDGEEGLLRTHSHESEELDYKGSPF